MEGIVTDTRGTRLAGIPLIIGGGKNSIESDRDGNYQILTPYDSIELSISMDKYVPVSESFTRNEDGRQYHNIVLEPTNPSLFYRFTLWLQGAK